MNSGISDLLGIHLDYAGLKDAASRIFTKQLVAAIQINVDNLTEITHNIGSADFALPLPADISKVIAQFKSLYKSSKLQTDFTDKRILRTLTYSLGYTAKTLTPILSEEGELRACLELLRMNWRDSYIIGLCYSLLQDWDTGPQAGLDALREVLSMALSQYRGTRNTLTALKENCHFFCKANGNLLLGAELARKMAPLRNIAKEVGVPDSWIPHSYFSQAIATYYEKRMLDIAGIWADLVSITGVHNSTITSKRILPRVIIQIKNGAAPQLREDVKAISYRAIGDPGIKAKWAPFGYATGSEAGKLEQARSILNEWITQEFITVFFEKCLNDRRRKKFWLSLSKHVHSFEVYGPKSVQVELKLDKRIADYVDARYHRTEFHETTAALEMVVSGYRLIEFSDPGYAFYAYKLGNSDAQVRFRNKKTVDSLRNSRMPYLVSRNGIEFTSTRDEGRLRHQDGNRSWEDVLAYWLRKYAGIQA